MAEAIRNPWDWHRRCEAPEHMAAFTKKQYEKDAGFKHDWWRAWRTACLIGGRMLEPHEVKRRDA